MIRQVSADPLNRSRFPIDEWRRLRRDARPSLKQLLLSDQARFDDLVPERGQARSRTVEAID